MALSTLLGHPRSRACMDVVSSLHLIIVMRVQELKSVKYYYSFWELPVTTYSIPFMFPLNDLPQQILKRVSSSDL